MNTSTYPEPNVPVNTAERHVPAPQTSTLIEFPRAGRANRPQWRKDLSERVREIQQRRALEAAREAEQAELGVSDPTQADESREAGAPQLGLVPQPEVPELNPIVAKALERIERARQQQQHVSAPRPHARGAGAATAHAPARYAEESLYLSTLPCVGQEESPAQTASSTVAPEQPTAEVSGRTTECAKPSEVGKTAEATHTTEGARTQANADEVVNEAVKVVEAARATNLVVVPPALIVSEAERVISEALNKPRPRRHLGEVADEALLARREAKTAPAAHAPVEEAASDRAPVSKRLAAGVADLLIVAFASSPFAAVIELTSGNWNDLRVAGSLVGIVLVLMFLYLTVTVAFSGRTWGMSLVSLRAVDARTGLIPTAGQCVRRALAYMLSLATLGLGLLLALFDDEGRAAHDHLSGTLVVAD